MAARATDLSKLEEELNSMLAADDLYWLRNSAKFRATAQTSNYEEFRSFVEVSCVTENSIRKLQVF